MSLYANAYVSDTCKCLNDLRPTGKPTQHGNYKMIFFLFPFRTMDLWWEQQHTTHTHTYNMDGRKAIFVENPFNFHISFRFFQL